MWWVVIGKWKSDVSSGRISKDWPHQYITVTNYYTTFLQIIAAAANISYCGVMGPNHTIGFWALEKSEFGEEYLLG